MLYYVSQPYVTSTTLHTRRYPISRSCRTDCCPEEGLLCQCALLTMYAYDAYQRGWYVEGFAIPDIRGVRIPFEHGWVELPDGRIIDPSFAAFAAMVLTFVFVLVEASASAPMSGQTAS